MLHRLQIGPRLRYQARVRPRHISQLVVTAPAMAIWTGQLLIARLKERGHCGWEPPRWAPTAAPKANNIIAYLHTLYL
jgi:hypothetical protein